MSDLDDMIKAARAVRDRAYAFYSHFPVGACIQAESGKLYVGCNIENAAYPHGMCAEAGAISAMIAGGDRRIRAVVVLAGGAELCSPCGGCRQQLAEFSKPTTPIHICGPGRAASEHDHGRAAAACLRSAQPRRRRAGRRRRGRQIDA